MKFSIITPFYNNNKDNYIQRIYESVINQIYTDFEWIITDDFSTDGTKLELLKLKDDRIRYVDQRYKKELFFNPQTYADGDIVVQLDSDDKIKPKALEVYNEYFKRYPNVLFMSCVSNYVDEKDNFQNNHLIYHGEYDNCLDKKISKDINWIKGGRNFLRINGAWGNLQSWRNIDIDFNPYNYQNIVYMDKYRALCLEEHGKYLHIPRTLYVNTSRDGSISKRPLDDKQNIDDAKYFDKIRKRRRNKINSYVKDFDNIFFESQPFLFSKLNDEKERKNISVFYKDISNDQKSLLSSLYFDHNLYFNTIDENIDYYYFQLNGFDVNDIKKKIDETKDCKEIILQSCPSIDIIQPLNINKIFEEYSYYNEFYGFELLII